ncbi:MAG: acyl-CoA dehydrogenase [Gammaproteobacteria bacterium]|nr:acyl-CoA dehydrogenase [Gammaproteobacteria bacterium]
MWASLFWFAIVFATILYVFYRRVPLLPATALVGAVLAAYTWLADPGELWRATLWGVFGVIAIFLNLKPLRRMVLTRPVLKVYRRIMPEMSDTEQAALEAGTVWWDGDLFTGDPDWQKLLDAPAGKLTEEEQSFLDNEVEELCGMLDEWKITHEWGDLPPEVWDFLKKKGFFAMIIPKEYGGKAFSAVCHSEVLVKIASRSPTCSSIVAVPNSLGPAELLLKYGTDEQKNHYLPRLADGRDIPCFALTGPWAGSDAGSIPDTGVVCKQEIDGKEVVGLKLNFRKRYITLSPIASVIGLAFKLYDPDGLMGDPEKVDYGITCALIPRDTDGVKIGRRHFPLNIPFLNGPIEGDDVFVPLDVIIGGPEMAGHGWRMLVECLSEGRSISLPSNTTGGAQLGVFATGAYSRIRKQFNMPIGRFEGVGEAIARMGGRLYAMNAARHVTASAVDQGEVPAVPSAIVKYHVTEMARNVSDDAMDVHGGKGICLGPNNYLGRPYQSVPIAITVEGANILTRSLMIFGQGAIRSHPWVLKEMKAGALEDEKQRLVEFDKALWGHIGFAFSNAVRALILAATHARFTRVPVKGDTRRYFQHINRYSAAFALVADSAMLTMGGALKRKEKISARLGDMLSYMYIASCALKRFEDQGRPEDDLPFVEWVCRDMIYRLQEQLHGLLRNFPNRPMAALLRMLVFPTGRRYSAPSDKLGNRLNELLINPSSSRDRLTSGVYTGDPDSDIGIMDATMRLAIQAEPLEKRIREAQKEGVLPDDARIDIIDMALEKDVIDKDDAELLRDLREKTLRIISVDDFMPDEIGTKPLDMTKEQAANVRQ